MKAMVLAAGRGERMRPLTDHCPKPLLRAGDKTLLDYHLDRLLAAGIEGLVINHAHLSEQIRAHIEARQLPVPVYLSAEPRALETGGGIFQALPLLRGEEVREEEGDKPFLVVNGDIWTDFPFASLLQPEWHQGQLAHLVLVDNPPQHPDGDFYFCADSGLVVPEPTGTRLTFSGISLLHPDLFTGQSAGTFPLAPLLRKAIEQGDVTAEYYRGAWFDIGTPDRLASLDRWIREHSR